MPALLEFRDGVLEGSRVRVVDLGFVAQGREHGFLPGAEVVLELRLKFLHAIHGHVVEVVVHHRPQHGGLHFDGQRVVFEANEAFAAQACAVSRDLDLDPAKVNPNGSGISLGHPIGATGALITVKALYELERIGGRYALVTMCIGGGQGIAAIFERV